MKTNETTFQNSTLYNRAHHNEQNPFTVITNTLINDSRLTVVELGLMIKILSNSENYIFNSVYTQQTSGIGKDKYNQSLKKLISLGYISKKAKNKGGWLWVINETPNIPTELTQISSLEESEINDSLETLNNEMIEFNEQPEQDTKINQPEQSEQTTYDKTMIFEEFENYINTNTWNDDNNYYIAEHRIESLIQDYQYSKLEIIRDNFEELRARKQLNWKDYTKIESKLKWLHHYQQVKPEQVAETLPF